MYVSFGSAQEWDMSAADTDVRIELVYDSDCPNVDRARAMIRAALERVGSTDPWTEWDRDDVRTPRALRRFGSPTVLVNGCDVAGDGHEDPQSDANSCRVYVNECGCVCGAPEATMIETALRTATARA